MQHLLSALAGPYGYLILFAGIFAENAGVPLPGETLLLAAAFLAQRGWFSLAWVIALGTLAATLGDNLGYLIGRRFGRRLIERRGRLWWLTPERLAAIERFFAKHGAKTVFFARFITGLRVVAALFAGMSALDWWRFAAWNAAGAIVWAGAVGAAGYAFADSWRLLEHWVGRSGLVMLGLAVAVGLLLLARRRRRLPAWLSVREGALALINLLAIATFAVIAERVVAHRAEPFDRGLRALVGRIASPASSAVMQVLSRLASAPVYLGLIAVLVIVCLRRRRFREAALVVGIALATWLLGLVLELGFQRVRPFEWLGPDELSFPSGHAMAAVAIYGMMAAVVGRLAPSTTAAWAVAVPIFALGVGVARIYLGAHWPTDVLAGYAAGAYLLAAGIYLLGPPRQAR